jgi:phage baseplate assembly protein gpV
VWWLPTSQEQLPVFSPGDARRICSVTCSAISQ